MRPADDRSPGSTAGRSPGSTAGSTAARTGWPLPGPPVADRAAADRSGAFAAGAARADAADPAGGCIVPDGGVGCSVPEVVDRVAGKWSVGIMVAAASGPIRFTELERAIGGISRRMLTLTLRNLERDGMLVRTVYPTVPPRVEYALTPMALELHAALLALTTWAERHQADVVAARRRYDDRPA